MLGRAVATYSHALPIDTNYIKTHGLLFDGKPSDELTPAMNEFINNLDNHIGRVTSKLRFFLQNRDQPNVVKPRLSKQTKTQEMVVAGKMNLYGRKKRKEQQPKQFTGSSHPLSFNAQTTLFHSDRAFKLYFPCRGKLVSFRNVHHDEVSLHELGQRFVRISRCIGGS
jgi:hypothetical protein